MISPPEKSRKKFVSKGRYAGLFFEAAGQGFAGMSLVFAGILCAFLTLIPCLLIVKFLWERTYEGLIYALMSAFTATLMGAAGYGMCRLGVRAINKTSKLSNAVPLTKTTALDLPAQESLVRAAAEPPVAPETVLLRAVVDNPTTPPEQLVRPSAMPE